MALLTISEICDRQFEKVKKGYDSNEVDAFLDKICDEIDNHIQYRDYLQELRDKSVIGEVSTAPIPLITTDEIMNKEFSTVDEGYDKESVHSTLEEAVETINHYKSENAKTRRLLLATRSNDEDISIMRQHEEEQSHTIDNKTTAELNNSDGLDSTNKKKGTRNPKKKIIGIMITAIVIIAVIVEIIMVVQSSIPTDRKTFLSEQEMKEALIGKLWNNSGYFMYQLSISENNVMFIEFTGEEYIFPIKKWDYQRGEIDAGYDTHLFTMKSGSIMDGKTEYTRAYRKVTKESIKEEEELKKETGRTALAISDVKLTSNSLYEVCTGRVTNNGKKTYRSITVKGSFKDENGNVRDTDWAYAVGTEGLGPGESSTFYLSVPKDTKIRKVSVALLDYD